MTTPDERSRQSGHEVSPRKKTALKLLNELSFDALKFRCPLIRPELLPKQSFKDSTANQLTQSVLHFIRLNGHQAERISTTGRPIDNTRVVSDCLGFRRTIGSVQYIPGTGTRGSSDISATIKNRAGIGLSVKIEIKINDRQSEHQKAYQQSIEAAGGIYLIVRNFQQFYDWYKSEFK
jgi:hypothetical protein